METFGNENYANICYRFYCEDCHYGTSKKSSFKNHCESKRHKSKGLSTNFNDIMPKLCSDDFECENCERLFKDRSGLWKHKKKCFVEMIDGISIKDKDALVMHLLKQNSDLQNKIIEMASVERSIVTHTNSHNTTNKTFNLNLFLNETCKNAMNITDFVSSIQVNLDDLENTGRQGYIEGISNIFLKKLKNLEQHMRPLHCSDLKREVFYIKENDKWEKETEEKPILTKAIKNIANKNIKQIKTWRDKYPECTDAESKKNNLYLKIVSNSMNGLTEEEGVKNIEKIISNVAKEVTIDKNNIT
jgi:hypothetical protein